MFTNSFTPEQACIKRFTHRKAKAVEYMVVDALAEADVVWNGENLKRHIWCGRLRKAG